MCKYQKLVKYIFNKAVEWIKNRSTEMLNYSCLRIKQFNQFYYKFDRFIDFYAFKITFILVLWLQTCLYNWLKYNY